MVAAGSRDKVLLLTADGGIRRWEWVTAIDGPDAGSGGVLDGPVTALEFDASGDLYAGNDIALNIHSAASETWTRVSGDMGLPMANITSLVTTHDPLSGAMQRWVGTARGLAVWSADPAADPPWRYLYGPRWHPGRRVTAMAALPGGVVCVATDGGVVWLEQHYARLVQLEATIMRLEGDISANLCVTLHPDTTCATCACA